VSMSRIEAYSNGEGTHVRPVERRTPARKAETGPVSCGCWVLGSSNKVGVLRTASKV
jgi:hypothetical protein